jgi:hypothetical protein
MVSLRAGSETAPPLCLALPPSPELADHLRSSSLDAEELYWQVLPAVVKGTAPGDKAAAMAAVQSWLLGKDWAGIIRRIPPDGGLASLAIVTSWGHVGLVADPPYARVPALAIFDPMQLRRLTPRSRAPWPPPAPPLPGRPRDPGRTPRRRRSPSWRHSRGRRGARDTGSRRTARPPPRCAAGTCGVSELGHWS